jgi:hypothetical protein
MAHTLITTHISVHYSISLVNCMLPQPRTNKHTVDVNLVVRWPIRSSDRSSICTLFQLICKLCTIITRAIRTYTISRSAHFTHITLIKRVDPSSYFPYPISRCTHSFSSSHTCSTSHTRYLDVPIHPAHLIHTLLPYSRMIQLAPHSAHARGRLDPRRVIHDGSRPSGMYGEVVSFMSVGTRSCTPESSCVARVWAWGPQHPVPYPRWYVVAAWYVATARP